MDTVRAAHTVHAIRTVRAVRRRQAFQADPFRYVAVQRLYVDRDAASE
ncbi:hypothetical protein [Streptomyces mirabilis]